MYKPVSSTIWTPICDETHPYVADFFKTRGYWFWDWLLALKLAQHLNGQSLNKRFPSGLMSRLEFTCAEVSWDEWVEKSKAYLPEKKPTQDP